MYPPGRRYNSNSIRTVVENTGYSHLSRINYAKDDQLVCQTFDMTPQRCQPGFRFYRNRRLPQVDGMQDDTSFALGYWGDD